MRPDTKTTLSRRPAAVGPSTDRPTVGPHGRALVIGFDGGVGRAVMGALARTELGRRITSALTELVLLDADPAQRRLALPRVRHLPPSAIRSARHLAEIVRAYDIDQVIDLSFLGTLECARACDELGVSSLNTSVENWPGTRPDCWVQLVRSILPGARPRFERSSHLVGSGMNPGVVNALVPAGLQAFAQRTKTAPTAEALDLYAILVTEEDTTVDADAPEETDVFPMTWSPVQCLEELLLPETVVSREGELRGLGHPPHAATYRARCGDRQIEGMVVPHEEIVTLAKRYPSVEMAFIYRLPPAARRALGAHPEKTSPSDWNTYRMYPPTCGRLTGADRVGVLLCSRRYGELWLGYDVPVAAGLPLGTGATHLQVAAGVLAGWTQLGARSGLHLVEELDWRSYHDSVNAVLGPAEVFYDPQAPVRSLEQRRVRAGAAAA
ncbi:MAG: saccharopine dehydrogenase NADP-binding domain-containing protein [Myxococcales bacterium]|jgi:homospermidine synthase